ncbi:MAG: hypothetical protein OXC44_05845 [Proteobacteria bacterium]|nr:hypothetical protein [Pseudomonadota bacterium]
MFCFFFLADRLDRVMSGHRVRHFRWSWLCAVVMLFVGMNSRPAMGQEAMGQEAMGQEYVLNNSSVLVGSSLGALATAWPVAAARPTGLAARWSGGAHFLGLLKSAKWVGVSLLGVYTAHKLWDVMSLDSKGADVLFAKRGFTGGLHHDITDSSHGSLDEDLIQGSSPRSPRSPRSPQKIPFMMANESDESSVSQSEDSLLSSPEETAAFLERDLQELMEELRYIPQSTIDNKVSFVFKKKGYGDLSLDAPKKIVFDFVHYRLTDNTEKFVFMSHTLGLDYMSRDKLAKRIGMGKGQTDQIKYNIVKRFHDYIIYHSGTSKDHDTSPERYLHHKTPPLPKQKSAPKTVFNGVFLPAQLEDIATKWHIYAHDLEVLQETLTEVFSADVFVNDQQRELARYFVLMGEDKISVLLNVAVMKLHISEDKARKFLIYIGDIFHIAFMGLQRDYVQADKIYADQWRLLKALRRSPVVFQEDWYTHADFRDKEKLKIWYDFLQGYLQNPKQVSHFIYSHFHMPYLHTSQLEVLGDPDQIASHYRKVLQVYNNDVYTKQEGVSNQDYVLEAHGHDSHFLDNTFVDNKSVDHEQPDTTDLEQVYAALQEDFEKMSYFKLISTALAIGADPERLDEFYDFSLSFFDSLSSDTERYIFLKRLLGAIKVVDNRYIDNQVLSVEGERAIDDRIHKQFLQGLLQRDMISSSSSSYPYFFSSFQSYMRACTTIIQKLTDDEADYLIKRLNYNFDVNKFRRFQSNVMQYLTRKLTTKKQKMVFFSMVLQIIPMNDLEVQYYMPSFKSQEELDDYIARQDMRFSRYMLYLSENADYIGYPNIQRRPESHDSVLGINNQTWQKINDIFGLGRNKRQISGHHHPRSPRNSSRPSLGDR